MPTLMGAPTEARTTGVVANRGAAVRRGTRSGTPTARAGRIVAGRTPGPGRRGAAERSAGRSGHAVGVRNAGSEPARADECRRWSRVGRGDRLLGFRHVHRVWPFRPS